MAQETVTAQIQGASRSASIRRQDGLADVPPELALLRQAVPGTAPTVACFSTCRWGTRDRRGHDKLGIFVRMTMSTLLDNPFAPVELRALLEAMVVGDLLGPAGGPDEELTERNVRDRYLVGVLAPRPQPQPVPAKPEEE